MRGEKEAVECILPLFPGLSERFDIEREDFSADIAKRLPIASISLDGPRALLTAFSLSVDASGVFPTGSFFSTFQPENELAWHPFISLQVDVSIVLSIFY